MEKLEDTVRRESDAGSGQGHGPSSLLPGLVVGDYRLERELGTGGMGTVFSAKHTIIGKRVAIKIVHARLSTDPTVKERFLDEARILSEIADEHIIDVYAFGTLDDGRPYMVMEYLTGRPLAELIDDGELTTEDAFEIGEKLCRAIQAVHSAGIVHRDIKPENIVVNERAGRVSVKVLDFGIAKARSGPTKGLTGHGHMVGTPEYMAPEQARGAEIDHRADTYAFGVVLYEMFTGARPFDGDSAVELLSRAIVDPPPPPSEHWPEIPSTLEHVILDMLRKDPDERPTLLEVRAHLNAAAAGVEHGASRLPLRPPAPTGREEVITLQPPRSLLPRFLFVLACGVGLALAFFAVFGLPKSGSEGKPESIERSTSSTAPQSRATLPPDAASPTRSTDAAVAEPAAKPAKKPAKHKQTTRKRRPTVATTKKPTEKPTTEKPTTEKPTTEKPTTKKSPAEASKNVPPKRPRKSATTKKLDPDGVIDPFASGARR